MTSPIDSSAFRRVLGHFATGITIAACRGKDGGPVGVTINSLTSVSLEPPLILFCLGEQTRAYADFMAAEHFSISILDAGQEDIARHFASRDAHDWSRIPAAATAAAAPEPPRLASGLGWMTCRRHAVHPGGDHAIIVGEVTALGLAKEEGEPLVYFRSGYRELG